MICLPLIFVLEIRMYITLLQNGEIQEQKSQFAT